MFWSVVVPKRFIRSLFHSIVRLNGMTSNFAWDYKVSWVMVSIPGSLTIAVLCSIVIRKRFVTFHFSLFSTGRSTRCSPQIGVVSKKTPNVIGKT